ncbi:MAG TPA: hypothetical protein VGH80_15630 [Xanthomonadaceae bacterium]
MDYPFSDELIKAAPASLKSDDLLVFIQLGVWDASGRRPDAVDCYMRSDPFKCLLQAREKSRPARIDVETPATDVVFGWGAAVAPDRTISIFHYVHDYTVCHSRYCLDVEYFKCEKPAALDTHAMQRTLCEQPYFGLDKQ